MTLTPVKPQIIDMKLSQNAKRSKTIQTGDQILGVRLKNVRKETSNNKGTTNNESIYVEEYPTNHPNENVVLTPSRKIYSKTAPKLGNSRTSGETTSETRQRLIANRDASVIPLLRSMENVRLPQLSHDELREQRPAPMQYRRIRIRSEMNERNQSSNQDHQPVINGRQRCTDNPMQSKKHRPNVPKLIPRTRRTPAPRIDTHGHMLSKGDGVAMVAVEEILRRYNEETPPFGVLFDELLVLSLVATLSAFVALVSSAPTLVYFLFVGMIAIVIFRSGFVRSRLLHGCLMVCNACRGYPNNIPVNTMNDNILTRRRRREIRMRRILLFPQE